jgi:hypothetical protein
VLQQSEWWEIMAYLSHILSKGVKPHNISPCEGNLGTFFLQNIRLFIAQSKQLTSLPIGSRTHESCLLNLKK